MGKKLYEKILEAPIKLRWKEFTIQTCDPSTFKFVYFGLSGLGYEEIFTEMKEEYNIDIMNIKTKMKSWRYYSSKFYRHH